MNETKFKEDAKRYFDSVSDDAEELQDWIITNTQPDEASEEAVFFTDGRFDVIAWVNHECLEATSHDILHTTGGPACGVSMVHGHPYFWYQDWFKEKDLRALQDDAAEFYQYIFEVLEELEM